MLIYCPECGTQTSDQAQACPKCAYPISKLNFNQSPQANQSQYKTVSIDPDFNNLDYYYQQEFEEIKKSDESYKGRWNWYAFLFTWIWCYTKGLWGYATIILLTVLITTLFKPVFSVLFGLFAAILMGTRGTWFYYNLKVKNKQFPN